MAGLASATQPSLLLRSKILVIGKWQILSPWGEICKIEVEGFGLGESAHSGEVLEA